MEKEYRYLARGYLFPGCLVVAPAVLLLATPVLMVRFRYGVEGWINVGLMIIAILAAHYLYPVAISVSERGYRVRYVSGLSQFFLREHLRFELRGLSGVVKARVTDGPLWSRLIGYFVLNPWWIRGREELLRDLGLGSGEEEK